MVATTIEYAMGTTAPTKRVVGRDELVENRLTNLLSGSNPYIQQARQRGINASASRGLRNSSLAGAASESAAIDASMPIASQDAATYAGASAQNADATNQSAMMRLQHQLSNDPMRGSEASVVVYDDTREREWRAEQAALDRELHREDRQFGANQTQADRDFQREMTLGDRAFRQGESESDRAYGERMQGLGFNFQREQNESAQAFQERIQAAAFQREAQQRNREMYNTMFAGGFGNAMQTVMSDPSLWGDPDAAAGFMERWTSTMNTIFQRYGIAPSNAPNGG